MARQGWLHCRVLRGMFSDEYAVIVKTLEGQLLSFFIPKEFVQIARSLSETEEIEGKVRVDVLDEDGNTRIIGLPREPFEGSRFARVAKEVLALA